MRVVVDHCWCNGVLASLASQAAAAAGIGGALVICIGGRLWCIGDGLVLVQRTGASRHRLTCLKSAAAASSWQWPLLVLASKI